MSDPENKLEHVVQFFAYEHLPPHLQAVSEPFAVLARAMVGDRVTLLALGAEALPNGEMRAGAFPLPRNPERTVALRKLLEAKDAAVRAALAKDEGPPRGSPSNPA